MSQHYEFGSVEQKYSAALNSSLSNFNIRNQDNLTDYNSEAKNMAIFQELCDLLSPNVEQELQYIDINSWTIITKFLLYIIEDTPKLIKNDNPVLFGIFLNAIRSTSGFNYSNNPNGSYTDPQSELATKLLECYPDLLNSTIDTSCALHMDSTNKTKFLECLKIKYTPTRVDGASESDGSDADSTTLHADVAGSSDEVPLNGADHDAPGSWYTGWCNIPPFQIASATLG